jgi:hypothetical protein
MERCWPQAQSRDVGVLTDPTLYGEALQIAQEHGAVTTQVLQRELGPRLVGSFLFKREQSQRVARQLLIESQRYGWLRAEASSRASARATCCLTDEGAAALTQFHANSRQFRRTS